MILTINPQYTKFVQFAEQQENATTSKVIARLDGEAGALDGRAITAATGDKVYKWGPRSQDNKDANNAVRALFRQTIVGMFGGDEANIPESVKDAMKLDDYGTEARPSGKPLTARRIMAVKAEVDKIIAAQTAVNNDVADKIGHGRLAELPPEFQNGLKGLVGDLRAIFGTALVPEGADISAILNPRFLKKQVEVLRDAANAQGRELTVQEVKGAYGRAAFERLATTAVGESIITKIKARQPGFKLTELSVGSQFMARHPGLMAEINICANPNDIAAVLRNHEAEIDSFVDVAARSDAASQTVQSKAVANLAARLNLDVRLVEAHVATGGLSAAAQNLAAAIMNGKAPGCMEPGYDVEAAFDALVNKFVQERADACAAIDSLALPEDVKNRWKAEYVAHRDMPLLTPAQLFEVAQSIDVNKLKSAFANGLPLKVAVATLANITKDIIRECNRVTGNPRVLANASVDAIPLYGMLIAAAESKDPALAPAIQKSGKFIADAIAHCEANAKTDIDIAEAATFVRTLQIRGGTTKKMPVMDQKKFLSVVGNAVDSALAECGVTDAHVCEAVKGKMLKRGENLLPRATGLNVLSDFLATVKADIAMIPAKQQEIVAKYSAGLPQETLPLLTRLAGMLNWRGDAAAASEEIVKNYVEDMKTWSNVKPGSPESKGLEEVFQRRMDAYLKYALTQEKHFNTTTHPGLCQDFLNDLGRVAVYTVNGTRLAGANLNDRLVHFMNSIKDPAKRKAVSMMVNQSLFGEFTTSIANRVPLVGWKEGMKDELPANIPGIEKFASRDIMKTGDQLFGTGQMTFDLVVSPDESTVTVHAVCYNPIHADFSMSTAMVGTCAITQDFVIDFTGPEVAIRDFKIGQTLT